eukprot:358509-Chlamydomonas_euryale.AAC.1
MAGGKLDGDCPLRRGRYQDGRISLFSERKNISIQRGGGGTASKSRCMRTAAQNLFGLGLLTLGLLERRLERGRIRVPRNGGWAAEP